MLSLWNSTAVRYVRTCVSFYFEKQIPRASAGLAYFLLLTLFPLLICVNAFVGLLHLDSQQVLGLVESIVPEASLQTVELYLSYISGNESGALLFAGVIAVFTSASAAFRTMMKVLADVYSGKPIRGVRGILVSILFPLGLLLTIYLSIGVIVTGEWLTSWLSDYFDVQQFFGIWKSLRFWMLFLVFFLFILVMSRLAVPKGTPSTPIFIGSILSACALVAASALFSWFVSMSTRYSLIYGSLMSIVVMMLWLYLCGNILLAGNVLSSVWYRFRGQKKLGTLPVWRQRRSVGEEKGSQ